VGNFREIGDFDYGVFDHWSVGFYDLGILFGVF
jgi:hypothetical protein